MSFTKDLTVECLVDGLSPGHSLPVSAPLVRSVVLALVTWNITSLVRKKADLVLEVEKYWQDKVRVT